MGQNWGSTKIIGGMEGVYEENCTSRGGSIKIKLMEPQGGSSKKVYNTIDFLDLVCRQCHSLL